MKFARHTLRLVVHSLFLCITINHSAFAMKQLKKLLLSSDRASFTTSEASGGKLHKVQPISSSKVSRFHTSDVRHDSLVPLKRAASFDSALVDSALRRASDTSLTSKARLATFDDDQLTQVIELAKKTRTHSEENRFQKIIGSPEAVGWAASASIRNTSLSMDESALRKFIETKSQGAMNSVALERAGTRRSSIVPSHSRGAGSIDLKETLTHQQLLDQGIDQRYLDWHLKQYGTLDRAKIATNYEKDMKAFGGFEGFQDHHLRLGQLKDAGVHAEFKPVMAEGKIDVKETIKSYNASYPKKIINDDESKKEALKTVGVDAEFLPYASYHQDGALDLFMTQREYNHAINNFGGVEKYGNYKKAMDELHQRGFTDEFDFLIQKNSLHQIDIEKTMNAYLATKK